ncbi:tripartite tricarboxylate transporter substrate-binding protein [Cupriavidus basilensis]
MALTDLLGGQVQLTWNNLSSNLDHILQGKLRALAVAAPARVPQLPDVPTFAELKLPDLNETSWTGLAAPAGTPHAIVQQLYLAIPQDSRGTFDPPHLEREGHDRAGRHYARGLYQGNGAAYQVLPAHRQRQSHYFGLTMAIDSKAGTKLPDLFPLHDELAALRQHVHRHPELAFEEYDTAGSGCREVAGMGIPR